MVVSLRTTASMIVAAGGVILIGSVRSRLGSFFVFPVHRHTLAGEDVCQSALVAEFAVALDEPSTDFLLLAWF